jgi:hypothetical protein
MATIVPLSRLLVASLFVSLEETVSAESSIVSSVNSFALRDANAAWYGLGQRAYGVIGTVLKFYDASGTDVSAQLREVVYVLNPSSSDVRAAVMVFHTNSRRIGVGVSGETFAEKFSYTASTKDVLVSTVAWDGDVAPTSALLASIASLTPKFPNLKVAYDGTWSKDPPTTSSLKPVVARIAVFAGSTGASLMGTEIEQTGKAYFGAPVVATAGTIELLGYIDSRFFVGMEQTVDRSESFGLSGDGKDVMAISWLGLEDREYRVTGSTLAFTGLTTTAELREVVYVLNWTSEDVTAVVMVFHSGSRRIGVCVSGATFAAKFRYTASTKDVLVSTVPREDNNIARRVPTVTTDQFPNISVAWDTTSDVPAISSVHPYIPRVAVVAGEQGSKHIGNLQAGATRATYFGKMLEGIEAAAEAVGATVTVQQAAPVGECEGYRADDSPLWLLCTKSGDAACATIATCAAAAAAAAATGTSTRTLDYVGASIELMPLKDAAGLYGTKDGIIYVVKPGTTADTDLTAKVIRKESGTAELFDASLVGSKWVVAAKKVDGLVDVVVPAECADLRACLKRTPLNLPTCAVHAVHAATCKPTVASGAKLEHGDQKVDLFTLGLADERALFGSDGRGVFVVSVSKDDAKKGSLLFVATGKTSVVGVEYDEDKQTWREVKGMNLILIGSLIGGGVFALIILCVVVYVKSRSPRPTFYAPRFPPMPPMPPM